MILISNLTKTWNAGHGEIFRLEMEDLKIDMGECAGLIGNNGAGKTTLLRIILDLERPDSGNVLLNDQVVAGKDNWKLFTGSYLGEGYLINFLKPLEYLIFVGQLHNMDADETISLINNYGNFIDDETLYTNKFISYLSAGNKQKLGILASILFKPDILILDEPFNSLDPKSQSELIIILDQLKKERTSILISSHNLNNLTGLCDRLIILKNGKVLKEIKNATTDIDILMDYLR